MLFRGNILIRKMKYTKLKEYNIINNITVQIKIEHQT